MNHIEENPAYGDTEVINRLVGHRITSVKRVPHAEAEFGSGWYGDIAELTLDNGEIIYLSGHDGGCACNSGCYELAHLATLGDVDNIITRVEIEDKSAGDDSSDPHGWYTIFIYADNQKINLAQFGGTDGNGYYGTGFTVYGRPAAAK